MDLHAGGGALLGLRLLVGEIYEVLPYLGLEPPCPACTSVVKRIMQRSLTLPLQFPQFQC